MNHPQKTPARRGEAERNALALQHLGLPPYAVLKFKYFRPWDGRFDDAVQAGNIGLLKAAASCDETRPFAPYALSCIRQEIADCLRDTASLVRIPRNAFAFLAKRNKDKAYKGKDAQTQKLARLALEPETLPQDMACTHDEPEFSSCWLFDDLHDAINCLSIRERWLLWARYWQKQLQRVIAVHLKCSVFTVRTRLAEIAAKLRVSMEAA